MDVRTLNSYNKEFEKEYKQIIYWNEVLTEILSQISSK